MMFPFRRRRRRRDDDPWSTYLRMARYANRLLRVGVDDGLPRPKYTGEVPFIDRLRRMRVVFLYRFLRAHGVPNRTIRTRVF